MTAPARYPPLGPVFCASMNNRCSLGLSEEAMARFRIDILAEPAVLPQQLAGSSCSALVSPARHFRSPSHALQSGPGGQRAGTRRHWDLVIAALRSPVSFARDELVTVTVREVHDGGLPSGAGRERRDADFILIV